MLIHRVKTNHDSLPYKYIHLNDTCRLLIYSSLGQPPVTVTTIQDDAHEFTSLLSCSVVSNGELHAHINALIM